MLRPHTQVAGVERFDHGQRDLLVLFFRHKKKPPSTSGPGELTNAHAVHDGTDRRIPHPHEGLIHGSAWKRNSANFPCTGMPHTLMPVRVIVGQEPEPKRRKGSPWRFIASPSSSNPASARRPRPSSKRSGGLVVASTRPLADGWASARRRCGSRGCPSRGRWPWSIGKGRPPAGRWKSSHALRIPSTSG